MAISQGYVIVPKAKRDAFNASLDAAGFGPDFFSVPIHKGNSPNATHYGASCAMAPDRWAAMQEIIKPFGKVHGVSGAAAQRNRSEFSRIEPGK